MYLCKRSHEVKWDAVCEDFRHSCAGETSKHDIMSLLSMRLAECVVVILAAH